MKPPRTSIWRAMFPPGPDGPAADRAGVLRVAALVALGFVVVLGVGFSLDRFGPHAPPAPPRTQVVDGMVLPAPIETPPQDTTTIRPGDTRLEAMWRILAPNVPFPLFLAGLCLATLAVVWITARVAARRGPIPLVSEHRLNDGPTPRPAHRNASDYKDRIARLAADPATAKYAQRIARGDFWWDAQIAYDRDPEALITCEHLAPLERALRRAGFDVRLKGEHLVEARCGVDPAELERRGLMAPPASYYEVITTERFGDQEPVAGVRCAEHAQSVVWVTHPMLIAPRFHGYDEPGPLLALEEIRAMVERLAGRIEAPAEALPSFGVSRDFGYPHVEVDEAYHWVVVERGAELERRTTGDLDELLYWVFEAVTHAMAMTVASRDRRAGRDFRRPLFDAQLALMGALRTPWAERLRANLRVILAANPFNDGGPRGL